MNDNRPTVGIVDYEMGNLFSVKQACLQTGFEPMISSDAEVLEQCRGIILPGVGAFGDAVGALKARNLFVPIRKQASEGKPLLGICLGMQLLLSESFEFGHHEGLDLIEGSVTKFDNPSTSRRDLPVPQVGWNKILMPDRNGETSDPWENSILARIEEGTFMYFNHSFFATPGDSETALGITKYGDSRFCSVIQKQTIFGCQFHPEKSGEPGLQIYKNFRKFI